MAELYGEHAARVLAICRVLLRDRVEAEDAAQQTFLSAHRALAKGSAPREPGAWLAAIARNECLGRIRGRVRVALPTAEEPAGSEPDAHAAAEQREQASHLRDALASLPAQQRDAILLREVRGLSYDEVAASLEVSTSAVESLLFRARRGLQTRLREAAAAVSTAGWAGYLGDLASRLPGGGGAAPAAAKVVVVGLGSAVVAGGAIVAAPHEIGAGHAIGPVPGHIRPRPSAAERRRTASGSARVAPVSASPRAAPAPPPEPTVLDRTASSPSARESHAGRRTLAAARVPATEREQEQPVATIRQSTRPLVRPGAGTSDDQPPSVAQAPETSTTAPPAGEAAARAEGGDPGAGERGVTSTSSDRAAATDGSDPATTDPTGLADPGTSRASERDD